MQNETRVKSLENINDFVSGIDELLACDSFSSQTPWMLSFFVQHALIKMEIVAVFTNYLCRKVINLKSLN